MKETTTSRRAATAGSPTDRPLPTPGDRELRPPNVLGLVIMREVRTRLRSAAYILSTVITMVALVGVIVVPTLFEGPTEYTLGVVGDGNQPVIDTATALANDGAEHATTIETRGFEDVAAAEAAVEDGAVEAALVDGSELVVATAGGFGGSDLTELLQRAGSTQQVEQLVGDERADDVVGALTADSLSVRSLAGPDAEENEGRAIVAYGGLLLTYLTILTYAAWTLTGVTEEKSNRVIELLLATARPWQLLAGKIVGISALGLGQFVLTVAAALVAIRVSGAFDLPALPIDLVGIVLLWVVLGFGMYVVLSGAAGALASKMEDAQTAMTPISMTAVVAFFLSFQVLGDPDGTIAVVATFVPLTAPFIAPIRFAFGALPLWQHAIAVAIALATTVVVIRLGARVYAGGVLRFGGRVRWREALRGADDL